MVMSLVSIGSSIPVAIAVPSVPVAIVLGRPCRDAEGQYYVPQPMTATVSDLEFTMAHVLPELTFH